MAENNVDFPPEICVGSFTGPNQSNIQSAVVTNRANVELDQATTPINVQSKLKSYLSARQLATEWAPCS